MDIKTVKPEEYADWLRSLGVPEDEIVGRMAHDALRALVGQLNELGVPPGFEDLLENAEKALAEDALERAIR